MFVIIYHLKCHIPKFFKQMMGYRLYFRVSYWLFKGLWMLLNSLCSLWHHLLITAASDKLSLMDRGGLLSRHECYCMHVDLVTVEKTDGSRDEASR